MDIPTIKYTVWEERINTWSHAVGIVMAFVVTIGFIRMVHGQIWPIIGLLLYMFGMLSSYLSSTIYHALPSGTLWKERFRKVDHAAIYWHIAGSYSPITLTVLREQAFWGWGLFLFVWFCAVWGTINSFRHLKKHSHFETICYIGMGLSVLCVFKPLYEVSSMVLIWWLIMEGICYIIGALFYSFHQKRYMHSVFHFFVLGGSFCHVMAIWNILIC